MVCNIKHGVFLTECEYSSLSYDIDNRQIIFISTNFRFSPCIIIVNHFYCPTNALNYTKLRG